MDHKVILFLEYLKIPLCQQTLPSTINKGSSFPNPLSFAIICFLDSSHSSGVRWNIKQFQCLFSCWLRILNTFYTYYWPFVVLLLRTVYQFSGMLIGCEVYSFLLLTFSFLCINFYINLKARKEGLIWVF